MFEVTSGPEGSFPIPNFPTTSSHHDSKAAPKLGPIPGCLKHLHQACFFGAGCRHSVIAPSDERWRAHHDGFGAASRHEPKPHPAVVEQVELEVPEESKRNNGKFTSRNVHENKKLRMQLRNTWTKTKCIWVLAALFVIWVFFVLVSLPAAALKLPVPLRVAVR